jgi:predicted aldo/keto reductase-like oxidoreductase
MRALHPRDSAAKWAFRYVGSHPNVLTALSGMTYMEHLQENIRTHSPLVPLTDEEYKILAQIAEIMINADYIQCTECNYCMPCPYGIDIPGVFGHYNRAVTGGKLLKTSNDPNYIKLRREFLIGYDRAVSKMRQADQCNGCDHICRPLCPQRLNIVRDMQRVEKYVEQLKKGLVF